MALEVWFHDGLIGFHVPWTEVASKHKAIISGELDVSEKVPQEEDVSVTRVVAVSG